MGVWNGRSDWLLCANFPGHEGELTRVSGTGVVLDCRRFCRKQVPVARAETIAPESVRYINLGHGKAALVDAADFEWLNVRKWRASNGSDYARATINGKNVSMHRLIVNAPAGLLVDHANGNKWDNRRSNLRICDHAENVRNRRKICGASRFKGVSRDNKKAKWVAQIHWRGRTIYLGAFDDEVEAAQAYDRKAIELFGEFACLNFPQRIRIVNLSGTITAHSHATARLQVVHVDHRQADACRCHPGKTGGGEGFRRQASGFRYLQPKIYGLRPRVVRLAAAGILLLAGVGIGVVVGQKACTKGGGAGYDSRRGSDTVVGTGLMSKIVERPAVAGLVTVRVRSGRAGGCVAGEGAMLAAATTRVTVTDRRFVNAGRLAVSDYSFFFAGGGTGGHIYPALAIAEEIVAQEPEAEIHFLCSMRAIDQRILGKTGFKHTPLPATGLYLRPDLLVRFGRTFYQSYKQANVILGDRVHPQYGTLRKVVVVGSGGFVAAPVCLAGRRMGVPVALVNVDIVPGRANRLCARWADQIFTQFEDSRQAFRSAKAQVSVVGCPLRRAFQNADRAAAIKQLELDPRKKTLLITGASSGSANINEAVTRLLPKLEAYAATWQIVHLTGLDNHMSVMRAYQNVGIAHRVVNYYDQMPDLYAAADLLIGRSGAVSVAEYAMAGVPSICMPYPYHKDRHQYLNAGKLVEVGAAVIVDDVADAEDRTEWLWEELEPLLKNDQARREMAEACRKVARPNAAAEIAQRLLAMACGRVKTPVPAQA